MTQDILSRKEKEEYEAWLREKAAIQRLSPEAKENEEAKRNRISKLLKVGNEAEFAKYYCAHLIDSEFAYFHKRDMKKVGEDNDLMAALEYPREHAKSTVFGVIMPLILIARKQFSGMVVGSANEPKANKLLADIQSELMFNKRFAADFGEQYNSGKWTDGYFVSSQGYGFWAFGRGQSPRGIKESAYRPKYGLIDDIDDKKIVKNETLVDEAVEWIVEDFYGCLPITGSRLIIIGNRIHKKSILAKFIGDVEPDDPKREGLYHSKVFALENPKTHKKDLSDQGVPAWKRYTREMIIKKMTRMGWRSGLREYFHEHIVIGKVFKEEHLPWVKVLPLAEYDKLITYNDPSYKGTKTSDFKSIVLIGKKDRYYDIIKAFCRQCQTPEMVRGHYNIGESIPDRLVCRHYMEANFIQDLMLEEYWREGEKRGKSLRIRGDKRHKPEKTARIEDLTAFTEAGFIRFNQEEKQSIDMQEVRNQFMSFPDGHDDGPDSVEGGVFLLNQKGGSEKKKNRGPIRTGTYTRSTGARG